MRHIRDNTKHSCPDIDYIIKEVTQSIKICDSMMKTLERGTDEYDSFDDIRYKLSDVPDKLDDLRKANSDLRDWGTTEAENLDSINKHWCCDNCGSPNYSGELSHVDVADLLCIKCQHPNLSLIELIEC